jgi:hypothetical protein
MEILTITELAAMLKMNKRQIYSMTDTRTRTGPMNGQPIAGSADQWQLAFPQE